MAAGRMSRAGAASIGSGLTAEERKRLSGKQLSGISEETQVFACLQEHRLQAWVPSYERGAGRENAEPFALRARLGLVVTMRKPARVQRAAARGATYSGGSS